MMGDMVDKMFDSLAILVILVNLKSMLADDVFVVVLVVLCVIFSFALVVLTLRQR